MAIKPISLDKLNDDYNFESWGLSGNDKRIDNINYKKNKSRKNKYQYFEELKRKYTHNNETEIDYGFISRIAEQGL